MSEPVVEPVVETAPKNATAKAKATPKVAPKVERVPGYSYDTGEFIHDPARCLLAADLLPPLDG